MTVRSRSVPAAARIEASGVRRSCETVSRRAVFTRSLSRAMAAVRASRREAVLLDGLGDLVGDRGEQPGVGRVRAPARTGDDRPEGADPAAARLHDDLVQDVLGLARAGGAHRAARGRTWTWVHSAGASPSVRRSTWIEVGDGGGRSRPCR